MERRHFLTLSRRELLRLGGSALLIGGGVTLPPRRAMANPLGPQDTGCGVGGEKYPTSPLIVQPFRDPLPIPRALAPSSPSTWRKLDGTPAILPGPTAQDSTGAFRHQMWPTQLGLPDPLFYRVKVQVWAHRFTSSMVQPIDEFGVAVPHPLTRKTGLQRLPPSTIYGFNGAFPGVRINAEYGRPVCVRFENELHLNPLGVSRNDFGSPDWSFLTHLHNGHTAPECDGNPNYTMNHLGQPGYLPGQWCDNLYLNWPPDNDPAEKQSFFWMHDHVMHHTGANVYKGMVGLYPIYDPALDSGDERTGLRLPGVRTNRADGAFDVDYDIPLALADCALDDGVIGHRDEHNGCGEAHPEWWGQTFFRHYPNEGFVGDILTVNGVAYPVLQVKRRKYRLRFLCASVARIYRLSLMSSSDPPVASRETGRIGVGLQGQYQLPDGERCMKFTMVATDGGLLPFPIVTNSVELWPSKRREVVVDFTRYMDGTPTTKGDVIYLVDTMQMIDGRQPTAEDDSDRDPDYRVPILKIVIGDDAVDNSVMPTPARPLRALPRLPADLGSLPKRKFVLDRFEDAPTEAQWTINGLPFDPLKPLVKAVRGSAEVWTIENGGGGWVHPMHIHEEEHRVLSRNGRAAPDRQHPDDAGKEDVVALGPRESVVIFRRFRTFTGHYVAHCHNLAHEDHSMMFGWEIVP